LPFCTVTLLSRCLFAPQNCFLGTQLASHRVYRIILVPTHDEDESWSLPTT
jgi:hypothetical protein